MASRNNQVPDLASVLKTLSAYVPNSNSPPSGAINNQSSTHYPSSNQKQSFQHDIPPSYQTPTAQAPPQYPYNPDTSRTHGQQSGTADSSAITAWPAALKHVMKLVGQNETIQAKIRRLIRTQHDHEKQWWEGRKALLAKQEARVEKRKKLDEVLRSVGGTVTSGVDVPTPEDELAEVKNYDKKVYKALTEMSKALDTELRAFGIPFFAIQHDLVRPPSDSEADITSANAAKTKQKDSISAEELSALRKRMLELLEDLCKD
ncbi:hypothetical protein AJ80_03275 [Polytolypa hystricis UAMH7299]|uniref:Uncharacterized protein n=1 Tax=Polytolypa hystricis (strain UAMH7299) TaxID=1447883 RepID=A0A2B7YKK0_POLH7|nr:hypothetical protein AJ80_03275 [Polytolypa hystricis UAMH7299]